MNRKNAFVIFGVAVIVIAALALLFLDRRPKITPSDVVEKLRAVSILTTTEYDVQVVVKDETKGTFLGLGNSKMLLVAKGTVQAGINLNQLDASAVSVSDDGKSITVNLPSVMVHNRDYSASQNPKDTYVYDSSKGIFADTSMQQTEVIDVANEALVESACKGGIMQRATTHAKSAVELLLKTIFPNVNVTVVSGPVPSLEECKAK